MRALKENVKRLESSLAAQHLADFADLFQAIPTVDVNDTQSILNVIDTWKQYRNVSSNNPEHIQAVLVDLQAKRDQVNEMAERYKEMQRQNHADLINLTTLKTNGASIAHDVDNLAVTKFGPTVISLFTALANSLRLTIDCLTVQVSEKLNKCSVFFNGLILTAFYSHSIFYSSSPNGVSKSIQLKKRKYYSVVCV